MDFKIGGNGHLVSTIIPVFNRPKLVRRAVNSVLGQSHRPIEIILVDDGSTDQTPNVLRQLQLKHPKEIKIIHQSNGGAGLARESGRLAANGDYIQYLDSDDYLLPNKFTDQIEALKNHPECAIAFGTSRLEDENGGVISDVSRHTGKPINSLFPLLLLERWWHTHTPLFRRWISDAAGSWPAYRPEDWDLEARMGALRPQIINCGSTVSVQVDHSSPNRVSRGSISAFLRDEAIFLPRLHACALLAGVEPNAPEMIVFSRWCFLRARQLDAIGENELAERMMSLARYSNCGTQIQSLTWQENVYRSLRLMIGSKNAGRVASLHQPRNPHIAKA